MTETVIIEKSLLRASRARLASVCLVGAWPGQETALATHLKTTLGCNMPVDGRQSEAFENGYGYRVHPSKVLVTSADDAQVPVRLGARYSAQIGSLSDQSHSKICVTLSGPGVWEVLQQGLPLDPEHALPEIGRFVQTRLGDANVLIHRCADQTCALLVPTTFAYSIEQWIVRAVNNINK